MRLQIAPISVLEFAQIALDAGGKVTFHIKASSIPVSVRFKKSLAVFSLFFPDLEPRQARNSSRIPLSAK